MVIRIFDIVWENIFGEIEEVNLPSSVEIITDDDIIAFMDFDMLRTIIALEMSAVVEKYFVSEFSIEFEDELEILESFYIN